MALSNILKNIYSFLEVLQAACTDGVNSWDAQCLRHAYQWARYCEQIYIQAEGKPYKEDLDQQIRQMNTLPLKLGDLQISLVLLSHATSILNKALLQNPNLSDQLFEAVISSYGRTGQAADALVQECYELNEARAVLQVYQVMSCCLATSNQSVQDVLKAHARLLLKHVTHIMAHGSKPDRSEAHVRKCLHLIGEGTNGMEVILWSLLLPIEGASAAHTDHAHKVIMGWIMSSTVEPDCSLARSLWKCPTQLLSGVAGCYFTFFRHYVQYLVGLARKHDAHQTWPEEKTQTWEHLYQHARPLWQQGSHVQEALTKTLSDLVDRTQHSLWQRLIVKLEKDG